MQIQSIIDAINNCANSKGIIVINGKPYSGKSWLISHLGREYDEINKKRCAIEGKSTVLNDEEHQFINCSSKDLVIDEAQLLDKDFIVSIANKCAEMNKSLILICQQNQSLPSSKLQNLLDEEEICSLHVQMGEFDDKSEMPIGATYECELVCR